MRRGTAFRTSARLAGEVVPQQERQPRPVERAELQAAHRAHVGKDVQRRQRGEDGPDRCRRACRRARARSARPLEHPQGAWRVDQLCRHRSCGRPGRRQAAPHMARATCTETAACYEAPSSSGACQPPLPAAAADAWSRCTMTQQWFKRRAGPEMGA